MQTAMGYSWLVVTIVYTDFRSALFGSSHAGGAVMLIMVSTSEGILLLELRG